MILPNKESTMNTQHDKILALIARLKNTNNNYVRNSGLGYCACASVELNKELAKIGIEGKLIYGKYLSETEQGKKSKAHFKGLVQNFVPGDDFHGRVKRHFVKNGNQLSGKGGHVGVLVNNTIYDVTSAQFGLPISYPLDRFLGMWDTAVVVDITLKPTLTSWNQKVQYSYKNKEGISVSQESLHQAFQFVMQSMVQESDSDDEDFYKWFSTQSKETQSNSRIVSADELGQDYMLHIDKQTPVTFVPMLPRSAAKSENNTTARITVAPSLIGCLIGYARAESDLMDGTRKSSIENTGFRGGYDICELPFKYCLFPNDKLVFDAARSQEHWLVSYNKETLEYAPTKIGKMFVSKITYVAITDNLPKPTFEIYIEIHKEPGIKFSPNIYLNKGFHKAIVSFERLEHSGSIDEEKNFALTSIDSIEYNKHKQLSAAMLSESNKVPKYLNW
jgi:hypothetical protein